MAKIRVRVGDLKRVIREEFERSSLMPWSQFKDRVLKIVGVSTTRELIELEGKDALNTLYWASQEGKTPEQAAEYLGYGRGTVSESRGRLQEAYSVRWQRPSMLNSQTVSGVERFGDLDSAIEHASQVLAQKGKNVGSLTIASDGSLDSAVVWKRNQRYPADDTGTIDGLDDDWTYRM